MCLEAADEHLPRKQGKREARPLSATSSSGQSRKGTVPVVPGQRAGAVCLNAWNRGWYTATHRLRCLVFLNRLF